MLKILSQSTPQALELEVESWCKLVGPIDIKQMSYTIYTNKDGQLTYSVALYYTKVIYDMS